MSGKQRARKRTRVDLSPPASRTTGPSSNLAPSTKRRSAPEVSSLQPDVRLAIDFGTKCTSIAYVKGNEATATIYTIQNFPDDPLPNRADTQVPTEIAYLRKKVKSQHGKQSIKKIYGYEIQARRDMPDDDCEELAHVTNVKLLLDKSPHLKNMRKALMGVLKKLRASQVIMKDADVLCDLLKRYLQHTKDFLTRDQEFDNTIGSSKVEITFCVPVCWNPSSNAMMSGCLQKAMKEIGLGVDSHGRCNLFMVNEAEAAATYTLTSTFHQPKRGEVFLLLDCGGGTTDVGVYEIGHEYPIRLGREVVPAAGIVCGSGDLNREFRDFAIEHLQGAEYPGMDRTSTEILIDSDLMPRFENLIKRSFSLGVKNEHERSSYAFPLRGLRGINGNSRVRDDCFLLSFEDMKGIFMPSLTTIADLMESQLVKALEHVHVDKVTLAGGFGDSPALRDFITDTLARISRKHGTVIRLLAAPPNKSAAGVATGALMRAQNKEYGPAKVPCQSIGIYHHVRNEPDLYSDSVLGQDDDAWELDEIDGDWYLRNTIHWIFKVGQGEFEPVHEFKWEALHIFTPAHVIWLAEYKLFASDECVDDYYTRSHPKNRGKTFEIGKVLFDLVPIKERIELHVPEDEADGEQRYECTVLIKMRLIDKYLDFSAYWPATGEHQITIKGRHEHLNVISAFGTGTS